MAASPSTDEPQARGVLATALGLPFWTLQVLTKAKSFRRNPVIGSPLLNRLGLHAVRLALAHAAARLRWLQLAPLLGAEERRAYLADGYLVKRDFLPPELFEALVDEVRRFDGPVREYVEGDTCTHFVLLDETALATLPACRKLLGRADYRRLHRFCGATNGRPAFFIQKILNQAVTDAEDPQKTLHADTFHPTMKSWLYLDDVGTDKGPLTYVPGSHRLTWKRLKWEYRMSLRARDLKDGHSEDGSFRFHAGDLEELGLPQPVAFRVPRNTLILANTFGLHCRGQAAAQATRLEIWGYSRVNPFNPLPGLDFPALARLRYRIYQAYWRHRDRKAEAAGGRAFEHPVETPIGQDSPGTSQIPR